MAATNMQETDAISKDAHSRSSEEKALRKAERNRRKRGKKKQEKKRKAEEAAGLAEQTPTSTKEHKKVTSPVELEPTTTPAKEDALAPATRKSTRVSNEGFKSARAHYSPMSARVSAQHIELPAAMTKSAEDGNGSSEDVLGGEFTTTRSPDPLAKEVLKSARTQYSPVRTIATHASIISPSALSVSEYENSIVMVDRPELGSSNEMTFRKPSIPDSVDSDDDGSIEGTIITQGAKATLSRSSTTLTPKPHLQALDLSVGPDGSDDEEVSALGGSDPHGCEPGQIKPKRHIGFPPPEDLPEWFPRNIKQIYRVDRHGGALSFKELNEITRYRAALERVRRQKWNIYIRAGEARWKLQKILRRLRIRPLTKAFYEYRNKQYKVWKEKALESWKRLEKTQLGVSILDETININFRQERIIYEKKLGGRL